MTSWSQIIEAQGRAAQEAQDARIKSYAEQLPKVIADLPKMGNEQLVRALAAFAALSFYDPREGELNDRYVEALKLEVMRRLEK